MRLLSAIRDSFALQYGHLFPWVPVCMAAGIGCYFALPREPTFFEWTFCATAGLVMLLLSVQSGPALRPLPLCVLLILVGFVLAGVRSHLVADTKLSFRYYGPIEGRIVAIDRSQSDAVRLTLDRVRLKELSPARTPGRVRVSLHGRQDFFDPEPGQTVIMTGHLSPPGGPVEPGGFNFQRQAWFQKLGAVGYTRTPALLLKTAKVDSAGLWIYRLRMKMSEAVEDALPGRVGGFAAAITTGDRSGIDQSTLVALRASNLAHLLAISGLHMGLLTGFVFASLRLGLAAVPPLSLRYPIRKWAAGAALVAGAAYLVLSGGNVATERAFIMVAVMFGAVMADKRAITLRAVALAAVIVLSIRPEALLGPGFQMSFAATTALVAVYAALRDAPVHLSKVPKPISLLAGVALSSAVAGAATAPIAAAHFNQIPHYGLLANIVSVPLMGLVIIPAAVLAALLSPFGLAAFALKLMEAPILWILTVAETVTSWPQSLSFVASPSPEVLPLLSMGAIWIVIWRGRLRGLGAGALALALMQWTHSERPELLISESGGLIGWKTEAGRLLSKSKGEGFAASTWLENDGDSAAQKEAAEREGWTASGGARELYLDGVRVLHATGKIRSAKAIEGCHLGDLVIVNVVAADNSRSCEVIDLAFLRENGSVAVDTASGGLQIRTARDIEGLRLWSQ